MSMVTGFLDPTQALMGIHPAILAIILLWSLMWKGFALWKAAAIKKSPIWFVVLLIINTIGILEILYIYIFSEMGSKKQKDIKPKKSRSKSKKL